MTRLQKLILGCLGILVILVFSFFVLVVLILGRTEDQYAYNILGGRELTLVAGLETSLGLATLTPTPTPSPTPTHTPTLTHTPTPTCTPSLTSTRTPTLTPTPPPTSTFTRVVPLVTYTSPATYTPATMGPTPTPEFIVSEYTSAVPESPIVVGEPYAEAEVLSVNLINEERKKANMPTLAKDFVLDRIAQERSLDMATRGYFSHEDPDGGDLPLEKLLLANQVNYQQAGENTAYFLGPTQVDILPELSVQKWMESPGHRDNILDINYNSTGFGIASTKTSEGTIWYLVQVFVQQ